MKLIARVLFWFFYTTIASRRRPDQFIGRGSWYVLRWWIFGSTVDEEGKTVPRRIAGRSYYLHCFLRPDKDVPHDHPWDWMSLILKGPYIEHRDEDAADNYEFNGAVEVTSTDRRKHYDDPVHVERVYDTGCFVHGRAEDAHRVSLKQSPVVLPSAVYDMDWMTANEAWAVINGRYTPAWTLFIAGKWQRDWGFHCPKGWVFWRDFVDASGDGVDRGCGEKA